MSHNVFADIGMSDPQQELTKARLVACLGRLIAAKGLSQKEAAQRLGIDQPKVSALLRGQWEGYSTNCLLRFLNTLDREARIVVGEQDAANAQTIVIG